MIKIVQKTTLLFILTIILLYLPQLHIYAKENDDESEELNYALQLFECFFFRKCYLETEAPSQMPTAPVKKQPTAPQMTPYISPTPFDIKDNNRDVSTLFEIIRKECGGTTFMTNSVNKLCVDKIAPVIREKFPKYSSRIIQEIQDSVNAYQALQCVGWVKAVGALKGKPWGTIAGSARNYCKKEFIPGGYECRKNPCYHRKNCNYAEISIESGDYPIWDIGTDGHIAYVTQVDSVNLNFIVREANYGEPKGNVAIRKKPMIDTTLIGWLRYTGR